MSEKEWFDDQMKVVNEGIKDSAVYAGIVTGNFLKSPECMLQLGAAILMEKPIVLMVMDGAEIPAKLRAIADKIIVSESDNPKSALDELTAFIKTKDMH